MSRMFQPWQLLVTILAGGMTEQQQQLIEYLRTEYRILKELHGKKRLLLTDDQRRRLTPRKVVERLVAADALSDQLKYSTVNLHPALRAMENLDETSDPADRFELTKDRPAPAAIGGHYVSCSFQFRDAETKQITVGAGFFHLLDADEWKVEANYITAVNGEAPESPCSLAQNYRMF